MIKHVKETTQANPKIKINQTETISKDPVHQESILKSNEKALWRGLASSP